jgi:PD-(D/E)XK nuclease superfamily protein
VFGDRHPRRQGDLGEAAAIEWLTGSGANVFVPLFHSPDIDLIAEENGRLVRVQVKTSGCRRNGRYVVRLDTRGGNQSWSGAVKRFDPSRYDALFVLLVDGRRWFIPSSAINGTVAIVLGGPKYAEYQVDRGRSAANPPLDSAPLRGDARAVKGSRL